eukprot:TRINITY_DN3618_c0_g3_i1.p1 TRINITY_DN3618_c0_g3~~TRINITY_DN3618_c0_g3_i1.p1  ORF type:complete len:663 (-),score=54.90 TRINITY_DN3618_c0_g3_i1:27-2015(-)
MGTSRRWSLFGLGHCPLRFSPSSVSPPRRARSLKSCLGRCEALGPRRCRFVSFVDTDVLRKASTPRGGACHVTASCPALEASTAGAVTLYRRGWPQRRVPQGPDRGKLAKSRSFSATIAVASAFDEASSWRKQICAMMNQSAVLRFVCRDPDAGLFRLQPSRHSDAAKPLGTFSKTDRAPLYIRHRSGAYLCADGGRPHFSLPCRRSLWHVITNFNSHRIELDARVRSRVFKDSNDAEACVWLRSAGSNLLLGSLGNRLVLAPRQAWNQSTPSTRWHVGFDQPLAREMLHSITGTESFDIQRSEAETDDGQENLSRRPLPQVWLMATKSYREALEHTSSVFYRAGDDVTVHVRWADDLRNVTAVGFSPIAGSGEGYHHFFRFSYLRFLLLFEALLHAEFADSSTAIFVMDLDIGVYSGWTHDLQSCVLADTMSTGQRYAHACFLQQPVTDVQALQLINAGLWVLRGRSWAPKALVHSLIARLQSLEVHMLGFGGAATIEHDQMSLNALLHRVRDESGLNSLRWAIYNPSVAYTGTFISPTPLSLRLYHATSSTATWKEKLLKLKQMASIVAQAFVTCPGFRTDVDRVGDSSIVGPFNLPCFYFSDFDPHFGLPLITWRTYAGFGVSDSLAVLDRPVIQIFGRFDSLDNILSRGGREVVMTVT